MFDTRHEKIIITIAAYIIGFTTAFIAYGLSQKPTTVSYNNSQIVSVASSKKAPQESIAPTVVLENDGLRVYTDKFERLLSFAQSQFSANVILSTGTSGVHYAIIDAEPSRDNNYVYFCEQLTSTSDTCTPFIYDVDKDFLKRVTLDGAAYYPEIGEYVSSWTKDNFLMVGGYHSNNYETPWELVSQ